MNFLKYISKLYLLIIVLLAVLPINGTSLVLNNNYTFSIRWDYLVHAIAYIPLVFAISVLFNNNNARLILLPILIAIVLEGLQYFISWRTFNINDMLSNILGAAIGFLIWKINYMKYVKQ